MGLKLREAETRFAFVGLEVDSLRRSTNAGYEDEDAPLGVENTLYAGHLHKVKIRKAVAAELDSLMDKSETRVIRRFKRRQRIRM